MKGSGQYGFESLWVWVFDSQKNLLSPIQ